MRLWEFLLCFQVVSPTDFAGFAILRANSERCALNVACAAVAKCMANFQMATAIRPIESIVGIAR